MRVVGARRVEVEAGHQLEVVVEVLGAEDLVGVLHEQHAAFAQEERQSVGEGDVVDVSGAGLVELAAVEIVPVDSREVDVAASLAFLEDRRSHQVVADEEVGLGDVVDVVVVVERVDQEERVVDRAESPPPDEDRVVVLKKRVPEFETVLGCGQHSISQSVGFLTYCLIIIMVSCKWIKSGKLKPS